jgi:hypothetical protein
MAGMYHRCAVRSGCALSSLHLTNAFTDEPRRSGRATKGQHTKERDEDTPEKKKGKGKGGKGKAAEAEPEEDEGDEIIRCVCGTYEEEEDVPRAMICCDKCGAWQHNSCMGLPEEHAPPKYFCEQCKPSDHKELVAAMKRGERPWEEAVAQHQAAAEAQRAKKKGAKKGGRKSGARASEAASIASEVDEAPATGQKRKHEEFPSVPEGKVRLRHLDSSPQLLMSTQNKKARGTPAGDANGSRVKTETPSRAPSRSEPVSGVAQDVKELPTSRRPAATNLIKLVEGLIKDAQKTGEFVAPSSITPAAYAVQLGLLVEHALYHVKTGGHGDPNEAYRDHLRTIAFNVKKNHALGIRLINKEITPHALAAMTAADMQTDDQKNKDKAMIKELERQHTIIEEQGPRIRRTHKGEEYVDESRQIATESSTSNAPVRKPSAAEQDGTGIKSPSQTPDIGNRKGRPSVDTNRRQSSTNFDINKVWSNVQGSPDADGQRFGDLPTATSPSTAVREPLAPGTTADADIDALLKDEEAESPPYSPADASDPPGIVWRGVVDGGSLGRFHAHARHAAGATPDSDTLRLTYADILPAQIDIGGRIQPQRADEYLCGLEYSNSSDLVIVCMPEPSKPTDAEQFDKFFRYFKNKDRFGVGIQHTNPAVKDIYLVPLDVGQEVPTFVKKLETTFPDPVTERMLLVPVVIKNTELAHNIAAMQVDRLGSVQSPSMRGGSQVAQTPITPHETSFPPTLPPTNGSQPQQPATFPTPTPPTLSQPQNPSNDAALAILGPELASCPSVTQLCQQAPNAGENEFKVVKECLEADPNARNDLSLLTVLLQRVHSRGAAPV